jgi:GNAT superfamily N-acetyltransferase
VTERIKIRHFETRDIETISQAFEEIGWDKPASQFERYLSEQVSGARTVLVALWQGHFAGYLTIVWQSDYPPFAQESIPEIVDFNVLPKYRRRGIGTCLMEQAEGLVAQRSPVIGIGVGMTADYGAAQRLYVKRGYVPDGRGLYQHRWLEYGVRVTVDDALALCFTKSLTDQDL